jgi:chromosome partitioning protein
VSAPIIVFFNNKGGVGKTSLVYNLAWMYAGLGVKVIAADLDHQANLTVLALGEEGAEGLWTQQGGPATIYGSVQPLFEGTGDIEPCHVVPVSDDLGLIPGDLALSSLEDELSSQWAECAAGQRRAFQLTTAFGRALRDAADRTCAKLVLVDTAPAFGAINRAALSTADHVVIPVSLDQLLPHNMKLLGKTLQQWRRTWNTWLDRSPAAMQLALPIGGLNPLGYVVTRPNVFRGQMWRRDALWMDRLPALFHEAVLGTDSNIYPRVDDDPYFLGLVRNYHSLMAIAHEAHRPVFLLRPADGAMGAHQAAVVTAWDNFMGIARKIASCVGLELEEPLGR